MKVLCYVKPSGSNFYARPIEGLFVEVDLKTRQVTQIVDEGVVPVAKDDWGYTEKEVAARTKLRRRRLQWRSCKRSRTSK